VTRGALRSLPLLSPDLVVLDVMEPKAGWLRGLPEQRKESDVPIVAHALGDVGPTGSRPRTSVPRLRRQAVQAPRTEARIPLRCSPPRQRASGGDPNSGGDPGQPTCASTPTKNNPGVPQRRSASASPAWISALLMLLVQPLGQAGSAAARSSKRFWGYTPERHVDTRVSGCPHLPGCAPKLGKTISRQPPS